MINRKDIVSILTAAALSVSWFAEHSTRGEFEEAYGALASANIAALPAPEQIESGGRVYVLKQDAPTVGTKHQVLVHKPTNNPLPATIYAWHETVSESEPTPARIIKPDDPILTDLLNN